MSEELKNLYDTQEIWKNPERSCAHGKQFYCQDCYEAWSEETKKMMEGIE